MKKICVLGHFGFGENLLNGQTVKTKIVTDELSKQIGLDQVTKIDTHGGIKRLPVLIFKLYKGFLNSENIIVLPAQNGLKIFAPLCVMLNKIFKRKIHYIVIGGWLSSYLDNNNKLEKILKKFDSIYVETSTMEKALKKRGFDNIVLMANFKNLTVLQNEDLISEIRKPYQFCTFSRILKEKGIEEAIDAIEQINKKNERVECKLDIYGQIDESQIEWFENLRKNFPVYISYKGLVPYDKSVEIIKTYYAVLFPTKFYTEGIPGTILDAYAAGVPVVCSKWESFADVVDDEKTGWGYDFFDKKGLYKTLIKIINIREEKYKVIKKDCLKKANNYRPENGIKPLMDRL